MIYKFWSQEQEETLGDRDETLAMNSQTAQSMCPSESPGAWLAWDLSIACVPWALGRDWTVMLAGPPGLWHVTLAEQ